VLDAERWAEIREWTLGADVVETKLTTFDAVSSRTYLDDHPALFADLSTDEERVVALKRRMLVEVSAGVEIRVMDPTALRVILVPDRSAAAE
jgi:hypothetical protein